MKILAFILSLFVSSFAFADDIKQLAPTVVIATRVETNSFDLPVSIDVVEQKDLEGYCKLNNFLQEDIVKKSYLEGFKIEKYGLLSGNPGVIEKEVVKEVVIDKSISCFD